MVVRKDYDLASRMVASALYVTIGFAALADASIAATLRKTHPARQKSQDDAPDTTATIAPQPTLAAPKADDDTLPEPFRLPAASRARMHECGLKWDSMKMSGDAGDETWRVFANHCLASVDPPPTASSNTLGKDAK